MFSESTWLICQELKVRGFEVTRFGKIGLYFAQKGDLKFYGSNAKTVAQSSVVHQICRNKFTTKLFLEQHNFPTARAELVSLATLDQAKNLRFPVVAKPLTEMGGTGVVTGIETFEELVSVAQNSGYSSLIVEETLQGIDFRVLIIRGKFFAACKRLPARVIGDGHSTIRQLIEQLNTERRAIQEQQTAQEALLTSLYPIPMDQEVETTLRLSGRSYDDVPTDQEFVFVRRNANASTGGLPIDVTDEVCPEVKQVCEEMAQKMGANTLGIDLMAEDLSQPLNPTIGSGVIEINNSPDLALHSHPYSGTPRNPAPQLVDEIIEFLQKNPTSGSL